MTLVLLQVIRWMYLTNVNINSMSQYGRHPHYQSSVVPDKSWDMVESSNTNTASLVGNRFGFPNGYPLNDGGNQSVGSNSYMPTSNGNSSSVHQNMHIPPPPPQPPQSSQQLPQQYWSGVRLPTASSANAYCQPQSTNPWINYQQRQIQQQQQQQMHSQLNVISGSGTSFANPLTSPTSPSVPSQMTSWPKLPQQITPSDDDSGKIDLRQQQSPTYLGHFPNSVAFSQSSNINSSDPNSYNGLLAAAAAESAVAAAAAAAVALNQVPHQSPNYAHHQAARAIPTAQTSPLYHSSLELDMLRTFASNASAKAAVTEAFPSKGLSGFSQIPNATLMHQNIHPPQHFDHSPRILNRSNGDNGVSNSAFCRPSAPSTATTTIKAEPQVSPNTAYSKNNDIEIAKTMLTIQNCTSPQIDTNSVATGNQQNSSVYQQISPPNNGNIKSSPQHEVEAEQVDISDNSDSDHCPKDISSPFSPPATHELSVNHPMTDNVDEEEEDEEMLSTQENEQETCKTPTALSIVEPAGEEPSLEENNTLQGRPQSSSPDIMQKFSPNGVENSPPDASTMKNNRSSFVQSSLETPTMSKDSSPESNSIPSPMVPMTFSGLTIPTISSAPLSFGAMHTSASLLSGPQNTASMGPMGMELQGQMSSQHGNVYTCHICRFSSTSKFHFNSHMNTHTDHKCKYCDYTSRTVGRLKRHMNDFHTHDDEPEHPSNANQESQDSSGHMSQPPSPDESLALMDQLDSVVSGVADGGVGGGMKSGSSSKPKTYRCKQCSYMATSKNEFWDHQRSHIKGDRVLSCPRCSFVTEYKHHLEYHLRNHFGSKPFKCTKCNYSCVNKSMLNSHMKSHSNFYQYRCMDCTYATKYCHSLKLHLRKYGHTPATVVNQDGTAVENIVLDSFGNRRSSKVKKNGESTTPTSQPISSLLPSMTSPTVSGANSLSNASLAPFVDLLKQQQEFAAMVTSIATLGAQLPTVPGFMTKNEMNDQDDNLYPPSQVLRCNFCSFHTSEGKENLTAHMMKHIMENKELCRMYGIAEAAGMSGGSTESGSSTPGDQYGNMQMDNNQFCSTPREEQRSGSGSLFFPGRRASPHEISQDSNSPASTSGGKNSGDEITGADQIVHSTSRRKGKAFKLDKIALRLQGRTSPSRSYSNEQPIESTDGNLSNDRVPSLVASGNLNSFKSSGNISSRSSDCGGTHSNSR